MRARIITGMQVLKRNPLLHSTLLWLMLLAALWVCLGAQTLGLKTASGQIYGLQTASWESTPLQAAPRLGLRASASESVSAPPVGANGGVNPTLLNELTVNGVKFTPENVIATARSPSGQVVFLETGDSYSGLTHIVQRHATDFANIGIPEAQIPSVVTRAVSEGNIVGYQGRGTGRPIYEVTVNGQPQRISITTGSNGYIVGANPAGSAP